MRSGKLRHRVILQKATDTRDTFGEVSRAWSTVANLWADVKQPKGEEKVTAEQVEPVRSYEVRIRYRAGVNEEMRVLVPSDTTTLAAAISTTDGTSATVAADIAPSASDSFRLRIGSELVLVTSGHGTTAYTIARGTDSTVAATHASGDAATVMVPCGIYGIGQDDTGRRELILDCRGLV